MDLLQSATDRRSRVSAHRDWLRSFLGLLRLQLFSNSAAQAIAHALHVLRHPSQRLVWYISGRPSSGQHASRLPQKVAPNMMAHVRAYGRQQQSGHLQG